MALTLRDAQGLTLTDEAAELASPQDRQALRNIAIGGTSQFGRGWESAGLGERANELFTQAAQMYNSGRVQEGDVLKAQAQDFQQQASQWAPTVQSASDVNSISSAADWMMGAAGNVRSSVRPALGGLAGAAIGAVATPLTGGMINPLTGAKIGGAIGAAWPTFNMEKQESVAEAMNDPEVMARNSHDDILNAGNVKGAVNTGIELLGGAPVSVMGRLLKAPVQAAAKEGFKAGVKEAGKALAKEAGGEFLTEGAQSLTGQATQNYLKGDQLSNLDYGQAFDEGAAGAVAGGLMSGVGSAGSLMKSAVGKGADVARNIADDPVGAASSAIADAGGVAGKYGATAVGVLERMISSPHRAHETLVAGTGASPGEYHVAAQEYATHVMQNKGYSEQEKKDAAQFVTDMVKDPEGATRRYRDKLTVKGLSARNADDERAIVEEINERTGKKASMMKASDGDPDKQVMPASMRMMIQSGLLEQDFSPKQLETAADLWRKQGVADKLLTATKEADGEQREVAIALMGWARNGFADSNGDLFVPEGLLRRFGGKTDDAILSVGRHALRHGLITNEQAPLVKKVRDLAAKQRGEQTTLADSIKAALPELTRDTYSDRDISELGGVLKAVARHGMSPAQREALLQIFGSQEVLSQAMSAIPADRSAREGVGGDPAAPSGQSQRWRADENDGEGGVKTYGGRDWDNDLEIGSAGKPVFLDWNHTGRPFHTKTHEAALNTMLERAKADGRSAWKVKPSEALREQYGEDAKGLHDAQTALLVQMQATKTMSTREIEAVHQRVLALSEQERADLLADLDRNTRFLRVEEAAPKLADRIGPEQISSFRNSLKPDSPHKGVSSGTLYLERMASAELPVLDETGQQVKDENDVPQTKRVFGELRDLEFIDKETGEVIGRLTSNAGRTLYNEDGEVVGSLKNRQEEFTTSTHKLVKHSRAVEERESEGKTLGSKRQGALGNYDAMLRGLAALLDSDGTFTGNVSYINDEGERKSLALDGLPDEAVLGVVGKEKVTGKDAKKRAKTEAMTGAPPGVELKGVRTVAARRNELRALLFKVLSEKDAADFAATLSAKRELHPKVREFFSAIGKAGVKLTVPAQNVLARVLAGENIADVFNLGRIRKGETDDVRQLTSYFTNPYVLYPVQEKITDALFRERGGRIYTYNDDTKKRQVVNHHPDGGAAINAVYEELMEDWYDKRDDAGEVGYVSEDKTDTFTGLKRDDGDDSVIHRTSDSGRAGWAADALSGSYEGGGSANRAVTATPGLKKGGKHGVSSTGRDKDGKLLHSTERSEHGAIIPGAPDKAELSRLAGTAGKDKSGVAKSVSHKEDINDPGMHKYAKRHIPGLQRLAVDALNKVLASIDVLTNVGMGPLLKNLAFVGVHTHKASLGLSHGWMGQNRGHVITFSKELFSDLRKDWFTSIAEQVRFVLAHEAAHNADRMANDSFELSEHEAFRMGADNVPIGEIAKEFEKAAEDLSQNRVYAKRAQKLAEKTIYGPGYIGKPPMQRRELFANSVAMYYLMRGELRKHFPVTFAHMEALYGNKPVSATDPKHNRAQVRGTDKVAESGESKTNDPGRSEEAGVRPGVAEGVRTGLLNTPTVSDTLSDESRFALQLDQYRMLASDPETGNRFMVKSLTNEIVRVEKGQRPGQEAVNALQAAMKKYGPLPGETTQAQWALWKKFEKDAGEKDVTSTTKAVSGELDSSQRSGGNLPGGSGRSGSPSQDGSGSTGDGGKGGVSELGATDRPGVPGASGVAASDGIRGDRQSSVADGVSGNGVEAGERKEAVVTPATSLDKLRAYLPLAAQSNVLLSNAIEKDISRLEKGFGANQKTTELLKAAEKQFGKPWETAGEAPKVEAAPTSLEDAVNKAAPPNFAREKELAKAKGADFVFAPEGVAGSFASRLAAAAKAMGKLVDPNGKEDLRDNVVYVSVPGAGRGFTGIQQLINDVQKLLNRGAIIRTDNKQHASTTHNAEGEGKLRTALAFSVVGGTIKEGALYTDWQKPQVARKAEAKPTSTFTADNFDTMLEKEDYGKLSTMDDLLAFARHTHARFVELDKVFNKEGEFANQRDELIYSSVDNLREDALDWLSPNSAAVQDFETWVHEALERKPTEGEVESFVRALAGREKASMEGVSETPMLSVSSDGVIKAVTFKTKGVVAINRSVYDKMSEQEKHALALHEIGVHYGMKRILGNEQYESVMAQLRALKGKSKLVDAAYKAVPESTHAMHVDEEAMAYLVEQRANLPVVTRLLKAVKTWFKETFGTTRAADEVFADDMVQIAESALRRYSNRVRQISDSNLSNTPKEGFVKLDFQKALNSDPFAHKLVDTITDNFDGKAMLTGSIAMSPQIDIYRDSGNQVHDLDFVYNGSMEELDATVYDTFKNAHRLRDIVNSDYTTRSFWISKDGRRVSKAVEGEKRGEVHLFDEQGNPIPADAGLAVDFFVGKGAATPTTQHTYRGADGRSRTIPLQHAAATMDAKFKMGREKDLNDALLAGSGDPVFSVGEKKASMMGAGAGIIVDGVAHPRENADGRAIYPTDAGIRNFWRWVNDLRQRRLAQATGADKNQGRNGQDAGRAARSGGGDGPLFDMEGRPKVLYHGTNADIEAFDLNHPDKWDNGWLGKGVYLSNDPDMANFYATQKGGASNVMPVYAALSNPYQFTADQKRKLSRASKEVVDSFTKGAIAKGYDGGILDHGNGTFEVVVFDPSAVKSATGNNGGFSAKDARVSLSEQNARTDGKPLTEEQIVAQVTAAMNEIHRMFGDTVKPEFKTAFGDNRSGEWEPNAEKNIIRLALNGDVMSTLFHESIHEFFDMLKKHGNLNTRDLLKRVADAPVLNRRIERLLHEHPAAQQQVHNNPEEAAAFLYQFWRTGQITLGGEINTFFKKVKHFLNRVLGLVSETARKSWMDKQQRYVDEMMVDRLFQTLTEGKLQSVNGDTTMRDAAMAAIKKDAEAHEKMLDNLDKAGRDFIRTAGKLFFSAEAMLRATRNPYMVEIAKAFNQSAGEAMETSDTLRAKQSLFDGLDQQRGIWIGKLDSILRGYEKEDLELARQALSTKIEPTDRIVREIVYKIRDFNDQMFKYITKRDVRRLDEKGKWVPVEKRADYFTRVWDLDALRDNAGKFREMLFKHHTQELTAIAEQASGELARHLLDEGDKARYKAMGDAARKAAHEGQTNVTPEMVADAIIERLLTNSYVDIAESESNVGLSPVATSVNRRELSWISDEHFDEFKSKDLVGIMTAYTASMVKRAEYTRVFGHGSEKLTQGVDKAKLHEMGGDTLIVQAVASLSGAIEQWKKKKAAAIEDGVEFNEPFPTLMGEGMKVFTASVGEEKARADLARAVKTLEQGVKAIMGMEGTLGRNASAPLRALNSTLLSYQNIRLLPGVLFSSINDSMGITANGGELKDAWNALVAGIREIRRTWKHEKGDDRATQRAEAWGTVDPGSFLNTIGQTYGSMWMTDKMRKFNENFFRWNGMEGWNRGTRIAATEVAERVILDYQKNGYDKSDKAAVARFETLFGKNFDPAHIAVDANGDLDLNNHNNQAAVLRWVNSAIIKPNAAHRTIWGSDTRMAAFWQYKQFSYSFHRVMIKAAVEQARLGNLRPAMVLAVGYAPIAIAAGAVKEMLVPGEEPPWMQGGLDDYLGYGLSRSGIFGVPGMGYDALWSYNGPVQGAIEGLGGPTVGQLLGGFTDPVEKSLLGAMPAGGWLRRAA